MDNPEEFEAAFKDIIDNNEFDGPDLQDIATREIMETLASVNFLAAQLSHMAYEAITSREVQVSSDEFMDLLKEIRDLSDKFNDEIEVEIYVIDDDDEEDESIEDD